MEVIEDRMIIRVNENNIMDAANIHSISWKESHRDFCTSEFIESHSPERQLKYISDKMQKGTEFFMFVDEVYGSRLLENEASGRVLEKCGFEIFFEGEGAYHDGVYVISKSIWR